MQTSFDLSHFFIVFGTGILASLSPCVYPILPITLGFLGQQVGGAGNDGFKMKVILYALGQSLAFVGLGIVVVFFGQTLGFSSQSSLVNLGLGILLLVAGAFSLVGRMPAILSRWNDASQGVATPRHGGQLGAFLLGVGSALIASPCTSPILGGVLALIATSGALWKGIAFMFVYSVGFSLLFVILGLGATRFPRSGRWLEGLHRASSFLLLAAGIYYVARGLGWI